MFYSTQILAKKGPLGTIWIAAHLDRRLRRNQVFETSIASSCDSIINPEAPLALRLSGQLLLGVVRIYSKKVGYLFQDCNDALVKIKQAFRPGTVDLPEEATTAEYRAVTLPEHYDDLEFYAAEAAANAENSAHSTLDNYDMDDGDVTARDSITLPETVETFEADYDEEERFDMQGFGSLEDVEPERLRAVAAAEAAAVQRSHGFVEEYEDYGMASLPPQQHDDEPPPPPMPEDDLGLDLDAAAMTPASNAMGRLSAGGQSLEDLLAMPTPGGGSSAPGMDLGGAAGGAGSTPQLGVAGGSTPGGRSVGGGKRKASALQIDASTELKNDVIRSSLKDTSDICVARQLPAKRAKRGGGARHASSTSSPSSALTPAAAGMATAEDGELSLPALPGAMGPSLYSVYARALRPGKAPVPLTEEGAIAEAEAARARASKRSRKGGAGGGGGEEGEGEEEERDRLAPAGADEIEEDGAGGHLHGGGFLLREPSPDMAAMAPPPGDDDFMGGAGEGDGEAERAFAMGMSLGGAEDTAHLLEALDEEGEEGGEGDGAGGVYGAGEGGGAEGAEGAGAAGVGAQEREGAFSARTRAVAGYLKNEFSAREAAGRDGPVSLGGVLRGKTRKEAARMFIECLVLRARGYVQLEQPQPYADIAIHPRAKLNA